MLDIRAPASPKSRKRDAGTMEEQTCAGSAQAELALNTEPFVNRPCAHEFVVTAPYILLPVDSQHTNRDNTTWRRICALRFERHEKDEES